MKVIKLIAVLLLINTFLSCGQRQANDGISNAEKTENTIKSSDESINKFIPEGYAILDSAAGDLNLDQYEDYIVILKNMNEEKTSDVIDNPEGRPLLILIGQANGDYHLAAKSNTSVLCYDCGGIMGDPYQGITIKNGYFSIEHAGGSAWRWTRIITYKFSKADNYWFLHRDGGESFHSSEPEKSESNMRSKADFGKVKFEDFNVFETQE